MTAFAQDAHFLNWGYPYVMDEFRFHMTLTERMQNVAEITPLVAAHFAPVMPRPFQIDALTLVGEQPDGRFQQIDRRLLTGKG